MSIVFLDTNLPDEVLLAIFAFLRTVSDISAAARASKKFYTICQDQRLWKHLCHLQFRDLARWEGTSHSGDSRTINYRQIFKDKLLTLENWRKCTPNTTQELVVPGSTHSHWRASIDSELNQVMLLSWHPETGLATFDIDTGRLLHLIAFKEPMVAEMISNRCSLSWDSAKKKRNVWIVGGNHEYVKCIDIATGELIQRLKPPRSYVQKLVGLSDDVWAIGGWANDISLFNVVSGEMVGRLRDHNSSVRVMVATSHQTLVSGGHDSVIRIWDCATQNCVARLPEHTGYVLNLEIRESNDPSRFYIDTLISSGTDGAVRIWKWNEDNQLHVHRKCVARGQIYALAFDRQRRRIISAGHDGVVYIWDEDSGECLHVLQHAGIITCLRYDERRELLVTGCNDFCVRIWDLRNGNARLCGTLKGSDHIVYHVEFDEDVLVMTNAAPEPKLMLWDFRPENAETGRMSVHSPNTSSAAPATFFLVAALVAVVALVATSTRKQ